MTEPTPNRAGRRDGHVSELTVIAPLRDGGASRLRKLFTEATQDDLNVLADVGSLHNMRWVFIEDDTKALFATTYDGDWDAYIDDFATKIPTIMDTFFGEVEGWPGIADPSVKDFIADHQITAAMWWTANPDKRVGDIERNGKVAAAVQNLLDAANP